MTAAVWDALLVGGLAVALLGMGWLRWREFRERRRAAEAWL